MAAYDNIRATVDALINTNGVGAITGAIDNTVLNALISVLSPNKFQGVITPTSTFGKDTNLEWWYMASTNGTYTNFGGIVVENELVIITYSGVTFTKHSVMALSELSESTQSEIILTSTDISNGFVLVEAALVLANNYLQVFYNNVVVSPSQMTINYPANGYITFDFTIEENATVNIWYSKPTEVVHYNEAINGMRIDTTIGMTQLRFAKQLNLLVLNSELLIASIPADRRGFVGLSNPCIDAWVYQHVGTMTGNAVITVYFTPIGGSETSVNFTVTGDSYYGTPTIETLLKPNSSVRAKVTTAATGSTTAILGIACIITY